MDKFEALFEGMDLNPEFKEKLKTIFLEAVEDKAAQVAAAAAAKEEDDEVEEVEDDDVVVVDEADGEGEEVPATETPEPADVLDILSKDPNFKRLVLAWDRKSPDFNRTEILRSFPAAFRDLQGNTLAEPLADMILDIFHAVTKDPAITTRVISALQSEADMEENVDMVTENIDRYLSYVAEEFMQENKLAVDSGIKTQIVESFIGGLKNLFVEHNMNVPEETDIVEKLNTKIDSISTKLNESYEKQIELKEENKKLQKVLNEQANDLAFMEITKDLPLTQIEKLKTLSESINYKDTQDFKTKLTVLVESVSGESSETKKILTEGELQVPVNTPEDKPAVDERVESYASMFRKKSE